MRGTCHIGSENRSYSDYSDYSDYSYSYSYSDYSSQSRSPSPKKSGEKNEYVVKTHTNM